MHGWNFRFGSPAPYIYPSCDICGITSLLPPSPRRPLVRGSCKLSRHRGKNFAFASLPRSAPPRHTLVPRRGGSTGAFSLSCRGVHTSQTLFFPTRGRPGDRHRDLFSNNNGLRLCSCSLLWQKPTTLGTTFPTSNPKSTKFCARETTLR